MTVRDETLSSNGYCLMLNSFTIKDELLLKHKYERDVVYSKITMHHIATANKFDVTVYSNNAISMDQLAY